MIVIGFASVIIGEVFFGRRSITLGLISAVVGSVVYRLLIAAALSANLLSANALKLISAVIVAATLSVPRIQAGIAEHRMKRRHKSC